MIHNYSLIHDIFKFITETFSTCTLYSALVSSYYNPSQTSNPRIILNSKCFTSWHFSNEITNKIETVTSSPDAHANHFSLNGFYGKWNHNIFHTSTSINPWIQYTFGKVVQIQKIIVKIRNYPPFSTGFANVEVRVGNTSASGDFSSFKLIDFYEGPAQYGDIIVLANQDSVWGQYLALQILGQNYFLIVAKVYVLGKM